MSAPDPVRDWEWTTKAACKGMDVDQFFSPDNERNNDRNQRERAAIAICSGCPVRRTCAEHALTTPENSGVWGGLAEDERGNERRRRRRAAA